MSREEDAFLEALKGEPDESDEREVYADWLEEHGRSDRAEYLRLEAEVRAFDFVTGNLEREQKKARRDELEDQLEKSDATWLAEVRRVARAPAARPRPTGVGRAEPIPAKPREPERELPFRDLAPMSAPLDTSPIPSPSTNRWWGRRFLVEILIALVLAFLLKDITMKGFLTRLVEDVYIRGHF